MQTNTFTPELRTRLFLFGGSGVAILVAALIGAYFITSSRSVSIDTATISAPLISLAPTTGGRLNAVYAAVGDTLSANAPVALVGTEVVRTRVAGQLVQITNTIGAHIAPGAPIAQIVDPAQLRVVGRIDENKGLSQLKVGDPVTFTVDAFGSRTFTGVLDQVSPTSNQSGMVFNISSQRETQQFDVEARFDTSTYSELKNGMSARMKIYVQ